MNLKKKDLFFNHRNSARYVCNYFEWPWFLYLQQCRRRRYRKLVGIIIIRQVITIVGLALQH